MSVGYLESASESAIKSVRSNRYQGSTSAKGMMNFLGLRPSRLMGAGGRSNERVKAPGQVGEVKRYLRWLSQLH